MLLHSLAQDHANMSCVESDVLNTLTQDQQSLLYFMLLTFGEDLYNVCFKRLKPEAGKWNDILAWYIDYTQKAVSLCEIFLILEEILDRIYWTRLLKSPGAEY